MDPANKVGNNNQTTSYIKFCSGRPAWLYVQYNGTKAELYQHDNGEKFLMHVGEEMAASAAAMPPGVTNATEAIEVYENNPSTLPKNVFETIDAAYNIILPSGIQTIKKGVFSYANEKNTIGDVNGVSENAVEPLPETSLEGRIDTTVRTIKMESIESLDNYAFYGCTNLQSVEMLSSGTPDGETIGNYTFGQCTNLTTVSLPSTVSSMGIRPFAGDTNISAFVFSPAQAAKSAQKYFSEAGIIYGYEKRDDKKDEEYGIKQCLPSRGLKIGSPIVGVQANDKIETIKWIEDEAFMGCPEILSVDLSDTTVQEIPVFCFADDSKLMTLTLPIPSDPKDASCELKEYALKDTKLAMLEVPSDYVGTNAGNAIFYSDKGTDHMLQSVIVVAPSDKESGKGNAWRLADRYDRYDWKFQKSKPMFTITFRDDDGTEIVTREVMKGGVVDLPTDAEMVSSNDRHPGKTFLGWSSKPNSKPNITPPFYASGNMTLWAYYPDQVWEVWFVDNAKNPINKVPLRIEEGESAETLAPTNPPHSTGDPNYVFNKNWIPLSTDKATGAPIALSNITGDAEFMADYRYQQSSSNTPGGNTPGSNTPGSNTPGSTTSGNNTGATYTLTVVNGSGSGTYAAGTMVTVAANTPNPGYQFASWTSSETDTNFTSKTLSATAFKMPAKNLTVTANYMAGGAGTSGNNTTSFSRLTTSPLSNTGTVSGNAVNATNGTTGNTANNNGNGNAGGGSSVQVNRPGISDAGAASATVNGATDNFVVKVTEDGQATAAMAEALRNEFGSLDNIRYFAMDISLYDESGTNKVTDTSGLSVTITLPIPDELRQYGGNNKVAAATNGNNLDKLDTRFTTVNGTPCVTFTATHFSPYALYVDTANLSAGGYDATPKTGDGIHPKWFLAVGLALFSVVLFLKKDKKVYPGMA